MSAEFWAVIGVGIAIMGFILYLVSAIDRTLDLLRARTNLFDLDLKVIDLDLKVIKATTSLDILNAKLGGMQTDVAGIKERLAAVEANLVLLVRGLHIEDSRQGDNMSDEISLQG